LDGVVGPGQIGRGRRAERHDPLPSAQRALVAQLSLELVGVEPDRLRVDRQVSHRLGHRVDRYDVRDAAVQPL